MMIWWISKGLFIISQYASTTDVAAVAKPMEPMPKSCCVKLRYVCVCSMFFKGVSKICMLVMPLTRITRLSVRM